MRKSVILVLAALWLFLSLLAVDQAKRDLVLTQVITQGLEAWHYSPQRFDERLGRMAFQDFEKRLDVTKSFLLQADIEQLQPYALQIDDELQRGSLELAAVGSGRLQQRIGEVRLMCRELLQQSFNFSRPETLELDADKRPYCRTPEELRSLWARRLKYIALPRYLELLKSEKEKNAKEARTAVRGEAELEQTVRQAVAKSMEAYFLRLLNEKRDDSLARFLNAVAGVFDPHSHYFPPRDKEDFEIEMSGALEGIGVLLGESDGYVKVLEVVPGGPAWNQNQIQVEDVLVKVGQAADEPVDVVGMSVSDVARLVRGKKGSEVRLTLRKPDGRLLDVRLVRDVVQIQETYARSALIGDERTQKKFGYIYLPKFYHDYERDKGRNSAEDVRTALRDLKAANVDGVILDLRGNGGGVLEDAVKMTGLFIGKGPVIQVKDRRSGLQVQSAEDPDVVYDGPLLVLVNTLSASASEIVAAALQDYGRALVVGGNHTFGKGTVQAVINLDRFLPRDLQDLQPLGAMALTVQKYYRISGASTQYQGVIPDIVLPEPGSYLEIGERYLEHSLNWDTVSPLHYPKWPTTVSNLESVRGASQERVKSSPRFRLIVENGNLLSRHRQQTLVSLNLADFRREQEVLWQEAAKFNRLQDDAPPLNVFEQNAPEKPSGHSAQAALEDKRQEWLKDLRRDSLLQEAVRILADLAFQRQG